MERLTKHLGEDYIAMELDYYSLMDIPKEDFRHLEDIVKKLATYEDEEEKGFLRRIPCKVGDEFWIIAYRDKKMVHVRCTGYTIQVDSINKVNHAYVWLDSVDKPSDYWKMPFEEFKHQCFFNYDEAKKALAEKTKQESQGWKEQIMQRFEKIN